MEHTVEIQPNKYPLFNEAASLTEAWNYIVDQIPKGKQNEFMSAFMAYHNTLVTAVENRVC